MNESLVAARRAKGWSQAQVAKEAGISDTHIAQLETGVREPSMRVARKLAAVLGVSVDILFGQCEPDRPASGE